MGKARWECVVVGGGAAGLSAALVLGRARRRTLVVDSGRQSNLVATGIGGLLGSDGRPPAELYANGATELAAYPSVELRSGEVVRGERGGDGFELELADGSIEHSRRVLLAMGMDYRFPELQGATERWGRSVFHCPFCHGWEVRERPLGVLDRGAAGVERALLLSAWSDDVTLLTNGPAEIDPAGEERLERAAIAIEEREVIGLRGPGTELEAVDFSDGGDRPLGGLLISPRLHGRSDLARQLGATLADPGPLAEDAIEVDPISLTAAPGVSAAGDVLPGAPSVANAVASGATAAAMIVHGLMTAGD